MRRERSVLLMVFIISMVLVGVSFAQPVNYALGKSYTANPPLTPSSSWWLGEDPPYTKYTDGISAWAWGAVSGWQGPDNVSSVTLIVDLGEVKSDIAKLQVDQFVSHSSAVRESSKIKCYGSIDGSTYTYWGDMFSSGTTGGETMWHWVHCNVVPQSAQYVKFELYWDSAWQGSHKLLSEIYVWSAEALDDAALGKSYSADPLLTPTSQWWLGENPPYTKYTDGTSAWAWGAVSGWQGTDNVSSVTLIVDLGIVRSDIKKVQVDQFVSHSSAVAECSSIKCYGSTDGSSFTYWADLLLFDSPGGETMWYWGYCFPEDKTARYVKYELYWDPGYVGSHKLLSEIYVWVPSAAGVEDWFVY
ncbi:hypothetical protein J7M23_08775 [Candidatus Sumerlaeota bacterium]|nr:hypothetical protein [Candidatus Sumerlaeota bacterium]